MPLWSWNMAGISTERFSRFAFPLVAVAMLIGAFLRFILEPLTGFFAGYLYFLPAVVLGAALGGAAPALAATVVATFLGLITVGHDGLSVFDLFLASIFSLNGLLISAIGAVS